MQTLTPDGQLCLYGQDFSAGRTSPEHSAQVRPKGKTSGSSSRKSAKLAAIPYMSLDLTPGHGNLLGESYWELHSPWRGESLMLNTGASPRDARVSSLSQILEDSPLRKYYLSRKACLGILRRSCERKKPLPHTLKIALMAQAGLIRITGRIDMEPSAYNTVRGDEAIDTEEVSQASGASTDAQAEAFNPAPVMAFAANQRDEVRDLHDVAGALSAQPGIKQQTYVAGIVSKGNGGRFLTPERHTSLSSGGGQAGQGYPCILTTECLNPWDTQQARVFTPEGTAPTLAGADGGGGRNPGGLVFAAGFCAGAGPSAGSIGYQEEIAPTLKAAASGNMMPSILCLNDQGGKVMECSKDVSGTLRAQEHGHQPLVFDDHGQDARFCDPLEIAQTVSASFGQGGNDQPMVIGSHQTDDLDVGTHPAARLFENHGIDARYTGPHEVTPTLSARAGTGGNNLPLVEVFSRQRVNKFQDGSVVSTQSARQYKDATDLIYQETIGTLTNCDYKGPNAQYVAQDKLIVEGPLLIRRLTPLECERLQGFPDGWTDLPGAKDAPRYKSLGNSVAVPCVEYIMCGISCVLTYMEGNYAG